MFNNFDIFVISVKADQALLEKIRKKLNFNAYLLMGWSESHTYIVDISIIYNFSIPFIQQIFIEISIFANFFLSVYKEFIL